MASDLKSNDGPPDGGKWPIFLLTFFCLLIALISISYSLPYLFAASTAGVLRNYEAAKDEEAVRAHLLEYRGEAQGQETSIAFINWGMEHPDDFIFIVDGVDPAMRDQLCERLGVALSGTQKVKEFGAAFNTRDSACLRIIRSRIATSL